MPVTTKIGYNSQHADTRNKMGSLGQAVGKMLLLLSFLQVLTLTQAFQLGNIPSSGSSSLSVPKKTPKFVLKSSRSTGGINAGTPLQSQSSNRVEEDKGKKSLAIIIVNESREEESLPEKLINAVPFIQLFKQDGFKRMPPMQVEDFNVLFYDIFLLVNLSVSISFWVTHRMNSNFIGSAFSEGCLLSILWIASGLYHGSFLMSAVDGHYGSTDERGGPKAAAALGLNTFISAINLRLVFAFVVAVLQHRQFGIDPGEQLLPLEIGVGLMLMSSWRGLHSSYTPRM
jgi:hypothetical protein